MKRWSLPVALAVCIFLKFILFDIIWSSDTTFQSFSQPESYLIKGAIALLLAFPMVFFRSRWYAGIVCFLLDILLVANLMYWRTYYTAIPWNSYFLAGNLADFMGSVYASVRWCDGLFFAMTLGLLFYTSRYGDLRSSRSETRRRAVWFAAGFLICVVATVGLTFARGGFQRSYEKRNTCATPTFTVFGTLCYEFVKESMPITPEIHSEIERWLSAASGFRGGTQAALRGDSRRVVRGVDAGTECRGKGGDSLFESLVERFMYVVCSPGTDASSRRTLHRCTVVGEYGVATDSERCIQYSFPES